MQLSNSEVNYYLAQIEQQISNVDKEIKLLPKGKLYCASNGGRSKWYVGKDHFNTYLPKKERHFARKILMREYLESELKKLYLQKNLLEKYEKQLEIIDSKIHRFYDGHQDYRDLLRENLMPSDKELLEWMNAEFEANPYHPESRIFETMDGHFVRSKSEVLISNALAEKRIPYRYECPLDLGDGWIYPDFTLLHPRTRKLFYWEHAGLVDNIDYFDHHLQKERRYARVGIYPEDQLIMTYETKDHPLSSKKISRIISEYFS